MYLLFTTGCLSKSRHGVMMGQIKEVGVAMDVNVIGKMILDGNAGKVDQSLIDARLCFSELMKERGELDEEENTQ